MKNTGLVRLMLLLMVFAAASFSYVSLTYARYADELSGSDSALIAKWNFSARGQDDTAGQFFNKGFTFDLFNKKSVKPMDHATKSFTFTGGGSDTDISYDVRMNVQNLGLLTNSTIAKNANIDVYAPFIFKIETSISGTSGDTAPVVFTPPGSYNGWFRPKDITDVDAEGYFSIFSGSPGFSVSSTDQVTVTVSWQWNTSCYIGDITTFASIAPDLITVVETDKKYLPYYQAAYDVYYGPGGLDAQRIAASKAVSDFLGIHGGPSEDGTWMHYYPCTVGNHDAVYNALSEEQKGAYLEAHEGTLNDDGTVTWGEHQVPCELNEGNGHFNQYNQLVAAENTAIDNCATSLLKAYDDYDTNAMNALTAKTSANVLFRIIGNQVQPSE